MEKQKKFIALLFVLAIAPCVFGCSNTESDTQSDTPEKKGVQNISPAQLDKMKSETDVILVDVREPGELTGQLGAISGVKNIPLGSLESRLSELDKDKRIVLICRSGNRSTQAANKLLEMGYDVYNLEGGMAAYRRSKK